MDWDGTSVPLSGEIMAYTGLAVLLAEEESGEEVWLPISQITTDDELEVGNFVDIEIPGWLARDKGLD